MASDAPIPAARSDRAGAASLLAAPLALSMRLIDWPMQALQRLIGERRMAYVFLLPNLGFFSLFVFLPLVINFIFSVTGGAGLFPSERPFVGAQQYAYLFDCGSFLDASSCREDHFWRGVANTARFTLFQVTAMVLFSLLTAVVLNMKIRARGFFRAVYFFPVLLSPVVVALTWKWICSATACSTPRSPRSAANASCSWSTRAGRCSGSSSSRSGPIWASTR